MQARALLKLQLPDHARGGAWRETVAGVHLPAVTALHLLRRRGTGGGAGAAPRWAVAQDEAFLALEAGAIDGPADFSPDAVHWRRAAVAPLPPTAEDEDLAWRVIAELRAAAGDEARRRAAAPPPQAPAPPPVPGSVAETVARTRTLVDTPVETLAAAAAAAAAAGATADAPLDAAAASVLFSYAQLPAVAVALRAAFSPLQLRRAERALNLLALPLLEVLEAACWRPPPPPEVLAAELASAGFDASDAWARWYARLPAMVAGAPAQPSGRPPTLGSTASQPAPTPQSTPPPSFTDARGETFAVLAFADNDDAGEAGCLRNAWRLGMHARWLLLVGGRRAYEAARAQPAPAAAAGVAARLRRLLPSAATSLGPQLMGSEAGTFVHAALHYETYAAHARRALSVGLLPRPPRDLPPASLAPLPGYIELLDRLAAHHASLRAWEPAGARLIDGIAAPAWGLDADDDWQLLAPPVECAAACYADDEGAGKD